MVDDIRNPNDPENKNEKLKDIPIPDIEEEEKVDNTDESTSLDDAGDNNDLNSEKEDKNDTMKKGAMKHKITELGMRLWPTTKKQKIIGGIIVVLLLIFGTWGVLALKNHFNKRPPQEPQAMVEEKSTEPSRLTGIEIPKDLNKRHVTSIMIENSPDARPQSGLRDAGLIYEAVAEGGITRFNALFLESQPDYIGPVRSVRPYYVELVRPFNPVFVHAGGSGAGLAKVKSEKIQDLDHGANAEAFQRISSRYAPHNLYTSMKALDKAADKRHYKASDFTSFARKPELAVTNPTVTNINFSLSGFLYNVKYKYDAKNNSYLRFEGGDPHMDLKSRKQLSPKVVIALEMKYSQSGIYSVYKTNGQGKMWVFQNGSVQKGTWKKKNAKSQFQFIDAKGETLRLIPGQTWITLVTGGAVSYK